MIVADTGAIIALLDADDPHHPTLRALYKKRPEAWLLPWAILPEIDYLAATQLGARVEQAWGRLPWNGASPAISAAHASWVRAIEG